MNTPEPRPESCCPRCGALMKRWKHVLTPGLVQILREFGYAVKRKGRNRVHLLKESGLDTSGVNNFQKLRYFGLVAKAEKDGEHEPGYWVLTTLGHRFLRGEDGAHAWVVTFRNLIEERSPEFVRITDIYPDYSFGWFQTEFGFDIKQGKLL